jgi:hypothetical protein
LIPNIRWSIAWPVDSPQFSRNAVPERSLAIIRCSDSQAASWDDESGNHWSAFLLRWNPGENSDQLAKGHRPDICYPAAGAPMVEDFGLVTLTANGVPLAFRHQSFEQGSKLKHVFYCLWSDRISPGDKPKMEAGSQISRLQAVLAGERNLGQQVLEIVLQGPDSSDEAVTAVQRQLNQLIQRP